MRWWGLCCALVVALVAVWAVLPVFNNPLKLGNFLGIGGAIDSLPARLSFGL